MIALYNIVFITLILLIILLFIQLLKYRKNILSLEQKNKNLTDLYDNIRLFKHDFNNIIFTIGGYIYNNDTKNLKKYYDSLLKDCKKINNLSIITPEIINNPGVYNLIAIKYEKATKLDIDMNLEIFFDFTKLKMPIYQFCRILGVLLDNAIEASSNALTKKINLNIRDTSNCHTQILTIENTYANNEIDVSKIFEKDFSQKKKHSGLGLWEVKQIVDKNNNIKLITNVDENYFKQTLEIYY
jgi:two-component system sensor histidine kinase AgrC